MLVAGLDAPARRRGIARHGGSGWCFNPANAVTGNMDSNRRDSARSAPRTGVTLLVVSGICSWLFLASTMGGAQPDNPPPARLATAALGHAPPSPDVPIPNQRVTTFLPITTLDNGVPIETIFHVPVVTTNLDLNRRYVGFQGDFTFDQSVVTFSPPFVEATDLTALGWSVLANILPGPGQSKVLRVSGFSTTLTPLIGTGTLFNLRMVRVGISPAATTALAWRLYPNGFEYIDDQLNEIIPLQPDGRVTITGIGPTATPTPVPVPTPCMALVQDFDDIYTLAQNYWVLRNNSHPSGQSIWFQGDSRIFPAHSGEGNSYIAANFLNGTGLAILSNWLLTPPVELHDGALLTFYTRTVAVRSRPDRLQVRVSTNGASADVGTSATSVGDFTTLLLDINPDYSTTGYPNLWTQYSVVLSGLGTRTLGRIGFRYFVENAGPEGNNSNLIGIDSLRYSSCGEPTPSPTPVSPTPTPGQLCPAGFTDSISQAIVPGNSVACIGLPPDHFHFDNSYWRAFNMFPVTGGQPYYVTSVSFGVEVARSNPSVGTQPIVVRLHRQMAGGFPEGTRTQLAAAAVDLPDQAGTVVNVPLAATVPAGTSQLIMEVFAPSGQPPLSNSFFVGSNGDGQTGPGYLSTSTCEYPDPVDLSILGYPEMHLVFNINGTCTAPTPSPTPTPTPTSAARPLNFSTRLQVGGGDDAGIGGFIILGVAPRTVLLRGIGPSLGSAGVQNPLSNPVLELNGPAGFSPVINNNWRETQEAEIMATGLAPANDLESAILVTLDPGSYTTILKDHDDGTGLGLVEIYDLSQGTISKLVNLSTRASVNTGAGIVISGFILGGGSGDELILVRGLGPSLSQSGVTNALANPALELRNNNGTPIASNDDWQNGPPVSSPPANSSESAIEMALSPGAYTALLSGVNNSTGVGLIEVYDRGSP